MQEGDNCEALLGLFPISAPSVRNFDENKRGRQEVETWGFRYCGKLKVDRKATPVLDL